MPTIRFWRDRGARVVARGTTLMAAAQRGAVPLGNACRAQGVCRACAVLVIAGGEHLEPASTLESEMGLEAGWRMACQTRVASTSDADEIVVWTPAWGGWPDESIDPEHS